MAEVKFTPGPWKVFDPRDHESNYGVDGADGTAVVFYGETSNNGIPRLSDAHLIAASPALYEALKECIADLEECADELCAGPMSGLAATINKARAALALAEGKKE